MIVPTDGMTIRQDTDLKPGIYVLPAGLHIASNGVTLDGNGAVLIGAGETGRGISLANLDGVTIKNLTLMGYHHGIYAQTCRGLIIQNCHIAATDEIPANTIFLDIWRPVEQAYGGGILLWDVSDSLVIENNLQHQMNGLLTYGCRQLKVRNNLANYCSGWGFHLYNTCDSLYENNTADFCCRYEPRGEGAGHMGADSAGFLIVYHSCRNIFRRNRARLGGDGFFLAGMTPQFAPVGCDDNLFEENDASYSPNIAFEATFSQGNIYRNNYANRCNYGFWLGFSSHSILENNQVKSNHQAGIATENGFNFRVRGNLFEENGHGILLWSKRIPAFESGVPENTTSYNWLIEENRFVRNRKAIRIAADQDHGIRPLPPSGEWGFPAPTPHDHTIRCNDFIENSVNIELCNTESTLIQGNRPQDWSREQHHDSGTAHSHS